MPQDKGPTTYREGQPPEVAPPANRNVPARQAEPSTDTGEDEAPRRRSRPSSSRTGAKKKKAAQKPRRR